MWLFFTFLTWIRTGVALLGIIGLGIAIYLTSNKVKIIQKIRWRSIKLDLQMIREDIYCYICLSL